MVEFGSSWKNSIFYRKYRRSMIKFALLLVGTIGFGLLRLFVLPGATRRRKRLGYWIGNYGSKPKGLPDIPEWTKLSGNVIRILALNPGPFTLQGTNTYLVGTGRERILIDTGDGRTQYIKLLMSVLEKEDATISNVLISHEHEDHIGGIPFIRKHFPQAKIWKQTLSTLEKDPTGKPYDGVLENGTIVSEKGATLRAILTPGHCRDHVAFYLEEEQSIFSGDCVLGSGTAVFEDLHALIGSLRILRTELGGEKDCKVNNIQKRIYPGHGLVVEDGLEKVEQYIQHRQLREDQILEYLEKHHPKLQSVDTLVEHIYADQHLNWILKRGATRSVKQHVAKLLKENRIIQPSKLSNSFTINKFKKQ